MELKPVTSSQIHAIGYDPVKQQLHIQFFRYAKGSDPAPGPIYEYDGITPEQHAALVAAESTGKHFGANIKSNSAIKYRKIG